MLEDAQVSTEQNMYPRSPNPDNQNLHMPNEFVRDVKADRSSFKSKGLQQPTHSNKLEKTELRV